MASASYHDFGNSYEAGNIGGPVHSRRLPYNSNHGRFHPYSGHHGYNRSSADDISVTCLQPFQTLAGYPFVPAYSDYFVTPAFSAYQGMFKNAVSGPVPVPTMAQTIMNENMLGLHSINMDQPTSQISTLPALQDVCSPPQVSESRCKVSQQVYDKSKSHPFFWRKRSEAAPGMTRTRDKYRVVYTEKQRIGLEKSYDENKFISMKKKTELSKELDLSERQIKIWFQNRRAKERRETRRSEDNSDEDITTVNNDVDYVNTENNSPTSDSLNNCRLSSCRFAENIPTIRNSITSMTNQDSYTSTIGDNVSPGTNQDSYTQHILNSDSFIQYESTCMRSGPPTTEQNTCMRSGRPTTEQNACMRSGQSTVEQRYSLSPSEFNSTLQHSITSNNVSPLNVNMDFGLYQRM